MDFFLNLFSVGVAYAANARFEAVLTNINRLIINPLISFLFALAVAYFLFGAFQFFVNSENEEKKTTGKNHMLWGVVGITIMLGVWFFLGVIVSTLGISESQINPKENTVNLPVYTPPNPNNLP